MATPRRRVTPALVAGAIVLLSTATVVLAVRRGSTLAAFLDGNEATTWLAGLAFGLIGAAVIRDAPGNRLGPVMSVGGFSAALNATATELTVLPSHPLEVAAAWAASVLWLPPFLGMALLLPLLYPYGRLPGPRWRWPAHIACTAMALCIALVATTQEIFDESSVAHVRNPIDLPGPDAPQLVVAGGLAMITVVVGMAAAIAVVLRMRVAPPDERGRYAWFTVAMTLGLVQLAPWPVAVVFVLNILSFTAFAVGIVRHRLFDIELVLSRTLVYLVLVLAAVAVYVSAAAALGARLGAGATPAALTALAALLLAPLQGRLHRALRRLLYGERDDAAALSQLGDRLAQTLGTDDVLPASVEAVRRTLRVPYAAITLTGDDQPACSAGEKPARVVDIPLRHGDEDLGTLSVGLRSGERRLSERDEAVLHRFAPQVAVAIHDVRTTRDLRRSREQILTLRERERMRIHRDLHDGLGPALAGISLGLETASRVAVRDGQAAAELLDHLHVDASACVDQVRRIVADLRPPALDEAGLAAAIRRRAELIVASTGGRLDAKVDIDVPASLPEPVEVAAYLIAGEALTNAARHSGAKRVTVELRTGHCLELRVEDDGCGAEPARLGTGVASMRQRALELDGTCTVRFRPGAGTVVHARLPLRQRTTA